MSYLPAPKARWSEPEPAQRLAAAIQNYWMQRGYAVNVEVSVCTIKSTMKVNSRDRAPRADIRSNLVNGLPPQNAKVNNDGV